MRRPGRPAMGGNERLPGAGGDRRRRRLPAPPTERDCAEFLHPGQQKLRFPLRTHRFQNQDDDCHDSDLYGCQEDHQAP